MRKISIILTAIIISACAQLGDQNTVGENAASASTKRGGEASNTSPADGKAHASSASANGQGGNSEHATTQPKGPLRSHGRGTAENIALASSDVKNVVQHSAATHSPTELPHPEINAGKSEQGRAAMIFMRSSVVASAVPVRIFDVSQAGPVLVGNLDNNTHLYHAVSPGRYVFMLVADSVDFLVAHVAPQNSYFTVVKPSMGVWKPRFSFVPVKSLGQNATFDAADVKALGFDAASVESMISSMTPTADSQAFTKLQPGPSELAEIEARYKDAWPEWLEDNEEQLSELILEEADGQKIR